MSVTTEAPRRRLSNRIIVTVIAVVLAIVLIAVVSDLTGSKVTSNGHGNTVLPTTRLVGHHVQTFSLAGLDGGKVHAPWTEGSASVLIFFASWCTPCKAEMPKVAAYIRTHNPSPIDVVGIDANDERSAAQAFVKKDGVTFPVAFDANGTVTSTIFDFQELPESVFINAKGIVEKVHFGAISEKALASGIKMLKS